MGWSISVFMKGIHPTTVCLICMAAFAMLCIVPATAANSETASSTITTGPVIFDEQFSTSYLDPAWTFIQRYGRGRYSLTDNPGSFRYYGEGSCTGQALSWWDPTWSHLWPESSYLILTFAGDRWALRTSATYHLHGSSNGNSMGAQDPHLVVAFDEGKGPKIVIQRDVDKWYEYDVLNLSLIH